MANQKTHELIGILNVNGYKAFEIDGEKWPKPADNLGPWTGGVTPVEPKDSRIAAERAARAKKKTP